MSPSPARRRRCPGARVAVTGLALLAMPLTGACTGESAQDTSAAVPEAGVRPTPPPETWTPPRQSASSEASAEDPPGGQDAPAGTASDTSREGMPAGTASGATGRGGSAGADAGGTPGGAAGPEPRRVEVPDLGHTIGSDRAPVQILEFSDFGCGYCRQFHLETWPALREEYVETGKVEWTYVPMTLGMFGASSIDAAEAGECAIEQDRFPPVRERLFQEQARWKRSSDAHAVFRQIVEEEGLDVERWQACMDGDRRLARVDDGTRLSQQIGVRGTPTFLVLEEGAIPGAVPLDVFRQILDQVYARRSGS